MNPSCGDMPTEARKILRTIIGAPSYIRNENIIRDLNIQPLRDEITQKRTSTYFPQQPNHRAKGLTCNRSHLRRNDLPIRQR